MKECIGDACKIAKEKVTQSVSNNVNYANWVFAIVSIIVVVGLFGLLIYGAKIGWFSSLTIVNQTYVQQQSSNVQPSVTTPEFSTCGQLCTSKGYSLSYINPGSCQPGEFQVTFGYPNQAPILNCCCYTPQATPNCVDSDNGQDITTPGHVTTLNDTIYDQCSYDNKAVYEYYCTSDGRLGGNVINCPLSDQCVQTRSGGHCVLKSNGGWNPGDTVFSGSGSGSISGGTLPVTGNLDLSEYGLNPGGSCTLGAELVTDWSYSNPAACWGVQSQEGVIWSFYDSNGLEYQRTDTAPTYQTIDLHPSAHTLEWDGVTPWKGMIGKTLNLPGCNIEYSYQIRIYIYSC